MSADVTAKFRYTGYLDRRSALQFVTQEHLQPTFNLAPGRLALCMVGGGQDGGDLAQASRYSGSYHQRANDAPKDAPANSSLYRQAV